jgi:hypothetical protein
MILFIFLFAWPMAAGGEQLQAEIDHLMDSVKNSDCQFIRNGKAHTSDEAVEHILRKYDHFKDKIKTIEDFIEYCASKSMLSKQPYKIGCPDHEQVDSRDWFLEELKRFRNR